MRPYPPKYFTLCIPLDTSHVSPNVFNLQSSVVTNALASRWDTAFQGGDYEAWKKGPWERQAGNDIRVCCLHRWHARNRFRYFPTSQATLASCSEDEIVLRALFRLGAFFDF